MKLCKDCKWCQPVKFLWVTNWNASVCLSLKANEVATKIDFVTGETIVPSFKPSKCNYLRKWGTSNCAQQAIYFEPKP